MRLRLLSTFLCSLPSIPPFLTQTLPISSWGSTVRLARLPALWGLRERGSPRCLTWSEFRGREGKTQNKTKQKKKRRKRGRRCDPIFGFFLSASVFLFFGACLNGLPGDDVAGVCKWVPARACVCVCVCVCVCAATGGFFVLRVAPRRWMKNSRRTNQSSRLGWLFVVPLSCE